MLTLSADILTKLSNLFIDLMIV